MGEIYDQSTNSVLQGNTRVITFVFRTIHTLKVHVLYYLCMGITIFIIFPEMGQKTLRCLS